MCDRLVSGLGFARSGISPSNSCKGHSLPQFEWPFSFRSGFGSLTPLRHTVVSVHWLRAAFWLPFSAALLFPWSLHAPKIEPCKVR